MSSSAVISFFAGGGGGGGAIAAGAGVLTGVLRGCALRAARNGLPLWYGFVTSGSGSGFLVLFAMTSCMTSNVLLVDGFVVVAVE